MTTEEGEYELVKEYPSLLEEVVEKSTHMLTRNHRGKKPENPLAGINVCF